MKRLKNITIRKRPKKKTKDKPQQRQLEDNEDCEFID